MTKRATGYVVLPFGGYPDTATDYVVCATRADVSAWLVDYGWMDNPPISVYVVTKGETAQSVIEELAASSDPYPDYIVSRGPRGGVDDLLGRAEEVVVAAVLRMHERRARACQLPPLAGVSV